MAIQSGQLRRLRLCCPANSLARITDLSLKKKATSNPMELDLPYADCGRRRISTQLALEALSLAIALKHRPVGN